MVHSTEPTPSASLEILIVDDDIMDIKFLKRALREVVVPHNTDMVHDGRQAMAYLRNEGEYSEKPRPDLIFLDLNMPRMNGHEMLAELEKDSDLKDIPVIMLTTAKDDQSVQKSYELHAKSYIVKPVSFDDWVNTVSTVVEYWFRIVKLPSKRSAA